MKVYRLGDLVFLLLAAGLVTLGACRGGGESATDRVSGSRPLATFGEERVFDDYTAVDVHFESEGAVLGGSLYLPNSVGPHPAVIFVHGAGEVPRLPYENFLVTPVLQSGTAFFSYDKRGVGKSEGECCPGDDGDFDLLAADVVAAIDVLRSHPEVNPAQVGLLGESQAGWIVPVAATRSPHVAFVVLVSGPSVTVGEQILYDGLVESGLSREDASRRLAEAGPSGFDPEPFLAEMAVPGLWLYGELDRVVPVGQSVAILERLVETQDKDFTLVVLPEAGHVVYHDAKAIPTLIEWIQEHVGG